ncbi:ATP-dependent helicase [Bradyrhizobium liaoningense]|uniref:ATP-dependent helicase n=1 Tax=Bradyrhizobium liaoningense TaxID=43992 RepID=UPI001BA68932|nr:ATP-dependent helicase [Bradyrhizobium liaoningense]MBR1033977.1 ATP-dependent helicase [Bradyrhizobium liaoningense]
MTITPLATAIDKLTEIQKRAVEWDNGPLLVLAGPGSGKTQVLTCRIARLLDNARDKNFRVLALTFTNKAADEMKGRVASLVPGLEDRANIGTFHSFCAQILRQHGVHLGIKPDFAIYSLDTDRQAVLEDALLAAAARGESVSKGDVKLLGLIDRMKARLIDPANAPKALAQYKNAEHVTAVYELYEEELRRLNALDFNSLILEAHRLAVTFPALAERYRRSHPFWLIDEFQDTNSAQYRLIRALAGADFKNVFCVADDDQIIYQWNGASFRHILAFLKDFSAEAIQLPTNYRCPPAIVDAANKLVAYNAQRSDNKTPLIAGKTNLRYPAEQHIQLRKFANEELEAHGIAEEIARRGKAEWGEIAVLGRTRALLERMYAALQAQQVQAMLAQRRDDFLSAEFRWLVAFLTQLARPLDKRNFEIVVSAFNRVCGIDCQADQVVADAEATGRGYINSWLTAATGLAEGLPRAALLELASKLVETTTGFRTIVTKLIDAFGATGNHDETQVDLVEDKAAWNELTSDIARNVGRQIPLEQFLQELQLRSKEPSPKPGTVTLMTVHGAKGKEFDHVYVIGLAEDILPSFQSKQKGDQSAEMEEERRNCFVAITRTKECLVLSRAAQYRGWRKAPSRFLVEMGLVSET